MKTLKCVALAVVAAALAACGGKNDGDEGFESSDQALRATNRNAEIQFSLVLKFDDEGFNRYFDATVDPASPQYRRFIAPSTIGKRFGPPLSAVNAIQRHLRAAGLEAASYPQRTAIHVQGNVGAVERYLDTEYRDFVTPAGFAYHAAVRPPRLPRALTMRGWVTDVIGLSTKPVVRAAMIPGGGLTPLVAARAYNISPLHARDVRGGGQTIAIASYARFGDRDVRRFDRRFGITGPRPRHVPVGGGTSDRHPEADLDVQVVRAVAPRAQILVYEAANTLAGEVQMLNAIANDARADIVSLSWGTCDRPVSQRRRSAIEKALRTAAMRGASVFVATGDAGAYECQRSDFADHRLTVGFPGDSPSVIAVGGTLLTVSANGTYAGETAWEDLLSNAGGGGGINPVAPRPPWQPELSLTERNVSRRRVPDVAAAASPGSPWLVSHGGSWHHFAGTSAAAPFWASTMLLVQQWAERSGAGRICFSAPTLYELARGERSSASFHDVTEGGNRHFRAGVGWDYATGLGSPNAWNLARSMVDHLKQRGARRSCAP